MEQRRRHPTEMMRTFIEERRTFLLNNRPKCIGAALLKPRGAIQMAGRFIGLMCNSPGPVRLIEQGTPAQWACPSCKRSWTQEPEPPDEA